MNHLKNGQLKMHCCYGANAKHTDTKVLTYRFVYTNKNVKSMQQ